MNWTAFIGIALWALLPGFIARKKGRSFWAYYFLSFVITPLITTIITLCLSKKISDPEISLPATDPPVAASITDERPSHDKSNGDESVEKKAVVSLMPENSSPSKIMYCRRCGSRLIKDSKFCSNCGNQVEKEYE